MPRFPAPTRESFIRRGAVKVTSKTCDAVAYLQPTGNGARPCAVGFFGKAQNPTFNYSFRDEARRAQYVAQWFANMEAAAARKLERIAERRAKMAQPHALKVGSILRNSWGYDQTNIDYFQVVRLIGARMVEIREIGSMREGDGYGGTGRCAPTPDAFIGKPLRKQVSSDGRSVKIHSWGSWAHLIEPTIIAGAKLFSVDHWSADH